jgi:hypothetical protein
MFLAEKDDKFSGYIHCNATALCIYVLICETAHCSENR